MVYVRLEREWTDSAGRTHEAGAMVDVDASTLATLEADGVVQDASEPASGGWTGPSGGNEPASGGWTGPSGGSEPASGGWTGPSGGGSS